MRINGTHYYIYPRQQAKKSRRRLLFIGLLGALLLLICYSVTSSGKNTAAPLAKATSSPVVSIDKNVQLVWPTVGQAAIGSVEDGLLMRSSNNEALRPTASMAKVIAALAIMEKQPLAVGQAGKSYVITSEDVADYQSYVAKDGSTLPVHVGMVLTQYQAMQAMLIASANNIADMLVERVFGSKEAYISYAQNMLHHMGLSHTIVTDASGFNPATVSTPSELIYIEIAALKNPIIAGIVGQSQAELPGVGVIKNTNKLLGTDGVVGIKTGTTDSAGSCLLFAAHYATKEGRTITIAGVIMGDTDATSLFGDTTNLLTSAKQRYGLVEI